jgi:hypothetical protein
VSSLKKHSGIKDVVDDELSRLEDSAELLAMAALEGSRAGVHAAATAQTRRVNHVCPS